MTLIPAAAAVVGATVWLPTATDIPTTVTAAREVVWAVEQLPLTADALLAVTLQMTG
jgi:hypothetical protein